jgi:hypothetical protein
MNIVSGLSPAKSDDLKREICSESGWSGLAIDVIRPTCGSDIVRIRLSIPRDCARVTGKQEGIQLPLAC